MFESQFIFVYISCFILLNISIATVISTGKCHLGDVVLKKGQGIEIQSQFTQSTELELVNSNGEIRNIYNVSTHSYGKYVT